MIELLNNVKNLPNVEICQTPEDYRILAERTLQNNEKVIYYMGSIELLMEAYEQAYEDSYYIPNRVELGILVKMLVPDTPVMRKYQSEDGDEVRETRALPADVAMDYSVMIHDDTTVFFVKEEKQYALSVICPPIAQTMKVLFNALWERSN